MRLPFMLTLALVAALPAAANCPTPEFQQLNASPAGHDVTDWAIGDFDEDGTDDVISVSAPTRTVKISINDGEGNYTETFSTTVLHTPGTVAVGDFNDDDRLDFVVSQEKTGESDTCVLCGRFTVYLKHPTELLWELGMTYTLPYASGIRKFAVADFNDDGDLDLAIAAPPVPGATQNLNVAFGGTGGTFPTGNSWTIDGTIADIAAGNLASPAGSMDALPDIVVAHGPGTVSTKSRVSVLINQSGSFTGTYTSFDLGSTGETMRLDLGDYSGDRIDDVAVTVSSYTTPQVQIPMHGARVLRSGGQGTLLSAGGFFTSDTPIPSDVAAVDLNQDGKLDIAFTGGGSQWFFMLGSGTGLGNQTGISTRTLTVPAAGLAGTDFDTDGRPDLLFLDTPNDQYVPAHNACFYHYADITLLKTPESSPQNYGTVITLTATLQLYPNAPMPQQGTVSFYDGTTLLQTVPLDQNGVASYSTSSLSIGDHTLRAVFNVGEGEPYRSVEKSVYHQVFPPPFGPPLNVSATGNSANNTITITWINAQDTASNEVFRMSNGQWVSLGTTTNNTFTDTERDPNQVYVYTVRSFRSGSGEASGYGNVDVATTVSMAIPLDRTIRASHVVQLRTIVNSFRTTVGLSAFAFTDPSLAAGTRIKAVHINQLRQALSQARAAIGLGAVGYTQPGITAGVTKVMYADIQEIKNGMS